MQNYDDIIDTVWPPVDGKENSMSLENRAKIFLPFAALKGFEDEVESRLRDAIEKVEEKAGEIQFEEGMILETII